jgi:hypothetical protein
VLHEGSYVKRETFMRNRLNNYFADICCLNIGIKSSEYDDGQSRPGTCGRPLISIFFEPFGHSTELACAQVLITCEQMFSLLQPMFVGTIFPIIPVALRTGPVLTPTLVTGTEHVY